MNWKTREKLILFFGSAGVTAGVVLSFQYLFPLVAPFVIGFLLACLLEKPICRLAKKLRGNKLAASVIITGILGVAIIGLLVFLGMKALEEIKAFLQQFDYYSKLVLSKLDYVCGCVDDWFGMNQGMSIGVINRNMNSFMSHMEDDILPSIMSVSIPVLFSFIGFFAAVMVVFISVIYLGKDMDKIRQWREHSIFSKEVILLTERLKELGRIYFKVQGLIIICTSAICTLGLFIMGNPYALVLGILIGVLDALPLFGTGTVFIPWSLVCLISGNLIDAAILYTIYMITYFLREFMESKLMGSRLGIAPMTMLLVIYLGLLVYGLWGFILGPVSYCIIKELILYLKKLLEHDRINYI